MRKRRLGRTDIEVTELGLGGLFVSSYGGEYEQSRDAVRKAVALGVNYIDTAPGYFNSEEVLGSILKDVQEPIVLSTKLGGRPTPFDPRDADGLLRSVEQSLRFLHRDRIDVLMVHEPDRPGQYDWWTDPAEVHGPVLDVLEKLKKDGVVGYTGLGGTTVYEMARLADTGKFDVLLTAFNYNALWREAEIDLLPAAMKHDMGIVIGSPLQQGALARRFDDEVNRGARWLSSPRREQFKQLYRLLDDAGMSITELAFRFVISDPRISTVLMGARSEAEVEQNIAAANKGPLPEDMKKRLDEIAAMVPFRPFEEPFALPFGNPGYKGAGKA